MEPVTDEFIKWLQKHNLDGCQHHIGALAGPTKRTTHPGCHHCQTMRIIWETLNNEWQKKSDITKNYRRIDYGRFKQTIRELKQNIKEVAEDRDLIVKAKFRLEDELVQAKKMVTFTQTEGINGLLNEIGTLKRSQHTLREICADYEQERIKLNQEISDLKKKLQTKKECGKEHYCTRECSTCNVKTKFILNAIGIGFTTKQAEFIWSNFYPQFGDTK